MLFLIKNFKQLIWILLFVFLMIQSAAILSKPAEEKKSDDDKKDTISNISFGIALGYNPNAFNHIMIQTNNEYRSGDAARLMNTLNGGLRFKIDFGNSGLIGLRVGLNYIMKMESEDTSSDTPTEGKGTEAKGSGFFIPVTFCLNAISNKRAKLFLGYGLGFTTYTSELTLKDLDPVREETVETSGLNWHFLVGTEVGLSDLIALSLEVIFVRGGQNDADYERKQGATTSDQDQIAVSHNMEIFQFGVNFKF
jgi:opacity protein-like surface antigen